MSTIGTISIDLEARLARLESQMDRAARVVDAAARRMEQVHAQAARATEEAWGRSAARITAALAAVSGALVYAAQRALAHADEMGKAARAAGVTVEQYSALAYAADRAGVSQQQLAASVRTFNRVLAEAQRGEGQAGLFRALGVSLEGDAIDVLKRVADALARVPDGAQRAEAAMRLFGRAGTELLPMLEGGAAELEAMMSRAAELGVVISSETAAAAERFRDVVGDLGARIRGAMVETLGDSLIRLGDYIDAAEGASAVTVAARGVFQAMSYALVGAVSALEAMAHAVRVLTIEMAALIDSTRAYLSFYVGGALESASLFWSRIAEALTTSATLSEAVAAASADQADAMAARWTDAWARISSARDAAAAATADSSARLLDALDRLWSRGERATQSQERMGATARAASSGVIDLSRALGQQQVASVQAASASDRWAQSVSSLIERTRAVRVDRLAEDMLRLSMALEEAERAGRADWAEMLREAIEALSDSINRGLVESLEGAAEELRAYARDLEREIRLLGASADERERLEQTYRSEEYVRRALAGLSEEQIELLEGEIDRIRELAAELEGLRDARGATFDRAVARSIEAGLEQASLESFFRKLAEGVKRAFSRASGESRAGAIERITGNFNEAANFALRLAQAWRSAETDLGRVVAVAAQIEGPIGQVAQAIQAIDTLFGGRLLGTRYQTIGERRVLSLTPMGIEGTQITIQERQRSLFRGRRRRELSAGLDAEAAAQLQRLFDEVERAIGSAAAAVGVRAPVIVSGRIEQEWDKDRGLVRSVSTVLGRTYTEAVEDFTRRITAESIFATLGAVLGDGVEALADRFRASAADLLDAAQTLVRIQSDIRFGTGLLRGEGDAFRAFEVVEVLARVGETLEQAYQRLAAAASALESGISGLGVMVERGRDAFVAFAGALADSVGGAQELVRLLDSAASLTDPLTRSFGQMELARRRAEEALAAVGLDDQEALLAELREALLAGDAELAASLLRVADAVRQARDATINYQQALEAQRERLAGYAREVGALELELFMSGLSASQAEIANARLQYQQMVESLHAAARAAGMAGARTEDLARAQELYARRLQAIAARLRADAAALVRELGIGPIGRLEREIAAIEAQMRASSAAITDAGRAWQTAAQQALSAADELLIGDLSPLSFEERLNRALELFRAAPSEQLARQVLELARVRFATGAEYAAIFAEVETALRRVGGTVAGPIGGADYAAIGEAMGGPLAERLAQLMVERDRLVEQQQALERAARAQELVGIIAGIAEITGQSIREIVEGLGVTFEDLAEVLGVDTESVERLIEERVGATEASVDAIATQTAALVETLLRLPDETAIALWDREPGTIARIADQQAESDRRDEERHEQTMDRLTRIEGIIDRVITKLLEETSVYTERTARATEALAAGGGR